MDRQDSSGSTATYYAGDPYVLAMMRFAGRGLVIIEALTILVVIALALLGKAHAHDWYLVVVAAICLPVIYGTMRRYGFGMTWHRHVSNRGR